MKTRVFNVLNFFAFNLLFFALYLNFVHKEAAATPIVSSAAKLNAVKGTVLVEHPEQYLPQTAQKTSDKQTPSVPVKSTAAVLSLN